MQSGIRRAQAAVVVASVLWLIAPAALACDSDLQCEGDNICVNRVCIDPKKPAKPASGSRGTIPGDDDDPATSSKPGSGRASGGPRCARDTDCPGDDECVDKTCRSPARARGSTPRPPPVQEAPPPPPTRPQSMFAADPPPAVDARRRPTARSAGDPFGAPSGGTSAALFVSLGVAVESAASLAARPRLGAEFHFGYGLTPDLSLVGIGDISSILQSTGALLPLTLAAAVRYRAQPVELILGAGFTVAPYLGAPDTAPSTLFTGLALLAEVVYPLPGTQFGLKGRVSFQPLSDVTLFAVTAGGGVAF